MSNQLYKSLKKNISIILLFFLINLVLAENTQKDEKNIPILYPSVLSLQNKGLIVVQKDGIHFYDSDKKEETSKIIKFETPIKSEEENEKISITQFPEIEGGYILVFVLGKLYIMKSDGVLFKKEDLPEINKFEDIKIIPHKEQNNNIFYIISYKKNTKHFGFNYYKFDVLEKKNSMIISKYLDSLKYPGISITSKNEIFGESYLFMKNTDNKEETFSCFLGVGFPAEIQVRVFAINNGIFEEKNNYRYLIGQFEIDNFKLISAIPNEEKNSCIIYYYKNNILSQIKFDFANGLYSSAVVKNHIDLKDEFWEEEANRLSENKETIFSSRLYFTYCKSYLIFLNENFALENKGFISHDNKCANLLSYYNFFRDNKYSMSVETMNNKVLVKKKRNLQTSSVDIQVPEKCQQDSNGYSEDSLTFNLCIKCNNAKDYYRVYDPDCTIYCNGQNFVQCFNETTKKNFYLDKSEDTTPGKTDKDKWLYMPCYETCEKCDEGGDAYNHKCKECALRYKFFNDSDNSLCEAECSYAYYYTIPLGYYECTETNSCPEGSTYLVPEIRKCVPNCIDEPDYPWTYAGKCYSSCGVAGAVPKDVTEKTCKDDVGGTSNPRCAVSYESFNSNSFITAEGIKSNAQTYAKDFEDSSTHINYYNNSNAILIIYKDESCVTELGLQVPSIDLNDECEDKIQQNLSAKYPGFDEKTDMIVALVGGSTTTSGIKSFYSFFYKDGTYINVTEICEDATVEVTKQIDLEEVDDEAEKIASQGINIFDLDSPFYQDVCFMYDSPNGKDATPQDRINTYFPNISICEEGCTPSKVNLTSFEAICKCEFNDIMSSSGGVGEKILEDSLGDLFEMIDASNIVIFKCAKDVFVAKHFFKNVGSYIALGIMIIQAACVVLYYLLSYNPMIRYLFYLAEYQCSVIDMKNNKKVDKEAKIKDNILNTKLQKPKEPPKKDENPGLKTPAVDKLIDDDEKKPKKLDLNNFNTPKCKNMQSMFKGCINLKNLMISNFDTSLVTNMNSMFYKCSSLTNLDLSKFNGEQLQDASNLFYECTSLNSLNLKNFNTINLEKMNDIFAGCSSLQELDLSSFKTSKITNMQNMFENCNSLISLNLNNFDTSQVTSMKSMFYNCSSLVSLEMNNWQTSNLNNMEYMFQKCSSLVKVNLSFDTSKVTLMNGMFSDCFSLTSVDLSHFNTTNVIDINCLFLECHSLTSIDLANVNFVNTKTYFGMFSGISDNGNIIYNKNLIREEIIALIPQSWNKTENEEEI